MILKVKKVTTKRTPGATTLAKATIVRPKDNMMPHRWPRRGEWPLSR
jgi:hypothetical protein